MSVIEKIRIGVLNDAEDIIKSIGNENLFDDLAEAVNDHLGITIMNVYNGMGAEEYVRRNRELLERTGIL